MRSEDCVGRERKRERKKERGKRRGEKRERERERERVSFRWVGKLKQNDYTRSTYNLEIELAGEHLEP